MTSVLGPGIAAGLVAGAVVLAGLGGFALYQKSQADRATFMAECNELAAAGNARAPLPAGATQEQLRTILRKGIACMEDAGMRIDDELKRKAGIR